MIKELKILGFRGFGQEETIPFAIPDGKTPGSGLTIITGANNSGKTTIIESIRAFNGTQSPTFSEGKRNILNDRRVLLSLKDEKNQLYTISTVESGGSSSYKNPQSNFTHYILPSRRAVSFEFGGNHGSNRYGYIQNYQKLDSQRQVSLVAYEFRLFQILDNKKEFDKVLVRILGKDFKWTIEQHDNGNYYIKHIENQIEHSSEGIGDGIWSIFTICAALFDAKEQDVVVIDEPELSVHPALQKRLMALFVEYSMTRQIVICTHSPYFVDWQAIGNGAQLLRVVKEDINSRCYSATLEGRAKAKALLNDLNNPHILGIEANEVFFLEDRIILVEGQEDVVVFNKIAKELGIEINGHFFGWGAGGAEKIAIFLTLFKELGYKLVVTVLDGNKQELAEQLKQEFGADYSFFVLPTDDIRDKGTRNITKKNGVADSRGNIKPEYKDNLTVIFNTINKYFNNTKLL